MCINEIADMVHANAVNKGFHETTEAEFIAQTTANIHGEVSEFWDAYRAGKLFDRCDKGEKCPLTCAEEELADIIIRAMDTAKRLRINIENAITIKHEYNKTRSYKHGKLC